MVAQVSGKGGGAETHRGQKIQRDSHTEKRQRTRHTERESSRKREREGKEWGGVGRKGERERERGNAGSNMWSRDLSLLLLEHPEPCVWRIPHPTSANTQCTHADVCTCSHTNAHTHTRDSPAAGSSPSHKLDQPLPCPRNNTVWANTPSVHSPSSCLPVPGAAGGGAQGRAPVPSPASRPQQPA